MQQSKELGKDSKMQLSDETIDKTTHIVYKVTKTVVEKVLGHSLNLITQLGVGYLYFIKFPNVSPFIKIPAIIMFNEIFVHYMRKGTNKLKENRIETEEKDV